MKGGRPLGSIAIAPRTPWASCRGREPRYNIPPPHNHFALSACTLRRGRPARHAFATGRKGTSPYRSAGERRR